MACAEVVSSHAAVSEVWFSGEEEAGCRLSFGFPVNVGFGIESNDIP